MSQPQGGIIDQNDVAHWKNRVNTALKDKAWNSASPPQARPWTNSLWACFSPPDLCCISCCLPCVTFGKTFHRLHKSADMAGYEPVNTSCIAFYAASCFGVQFLLQAMQSQTIRERHNLEGSCVKDILCACCCGCCAVIQAEKESKLRASEAGTAPEQYKNEQMVMPGAQH